MVQVEHEQNLMSIKSLSTAFKASTELMLVLMLVCLLWSHQS